MGNLAVTLKNPPAGATLWDLALCDWDITTLMNWVGRGSGIQAYLDIAQAAIFEVPGSLVYPLRIVRLTIDKWNADKTALIELYYIQSYRPYLWDWEKGGWGTTPDPTYREVFIPELGNFRYNVATEKFEPVELVPAFRNFGFQEYVLV